MEGLGNEWLEGAGCKFPKEQKKLYLKKGRRKRVGPRPGSKWATQKQVISVFVEYTLFCLFTMASNFLFLLVLFVYFCMCVSCYFASLFNSVFCFICLFVF